MSSACLGKKSAGRRSRAERARCTAEIVDEAMTAMLQELVKPLLIMNTEKSCIFIEKLWIFTEI